MVRSTSFFRSKICYGLRCDLCDSALAFGAIHELNEWLVLPATLKDPINERHRFNESVNCCERVSVVKVRQILRKNRLNKREDEHKSYFRDKTRAKLQSKRRATATGQILKKWQIDIYQFCLFRHRCHIKSTTANNQVLLGNNQFSIICDVHLNWKITYNYLTAFDLTDDVIRLKRYRTFIVKLNIQLVNKLLTIQISAIIFKFYSI